MKNKFFKDLISSNSPLQNLILFLGIFTFIIIFIDISSEIAIEKNEIISVIDITEQIDLDPAPVTLSVIIPDTPKAGIIIFNERDPVSQVYFSFNHNKAPPHELL